MIINNNKWQYKFKNLKQRTSKLRLMQYLDQNSPQLINESYKIWKKSVPHLYNILHSYPLSTASMTIQWLSQCNATSTHTIHQLLLGSNSLQNNYISKVQIKLPTDQTIINGNQYKEDVEEGIETFGARELQQNMKIMQEGEIMKARISKIHGNQQNILAVKVGGNNHQINVYNINYQEVQLEQNKISLVGHQAQGYGLSWNKHNASLIASCSYDNKVCLWDISNGSSQITPSQTFLLSQTPQQISWSYHNSSLFCIGSQQKHLSLFDIRQSSNKPFLSKLAHSGQIYALDFNPFCGNLLISGCELGDVFLWDVRNMSRKLNSFVGHNDAVTKLQWSNHKQTQFVSGSNDRKIVCWDIANIQQNNDINKNNQSKSEIQFIHNGHRSRITDIAFSSHQNVIASCQENNVMQVWQMAESLLN